jgi:hypothetical protein
VVITEIAADKEELKRRILEDIHKYIDPKLLKMDTMVRSHLDAPATVDESIAKVKLKNPNMLSLLFSLSLAVRFPSAT